MAELEFDYKQVKTIIQVNLNDKFEVALKKYTLKSKIDLEKNNKIIVISIII